MKRIITSIILIIVVAAGIWLWKSKREPQSQSVTADYKNTTYTVEDEQITLVDGHAESPVPGASNVVTQYFGDESSGDLNGDGLPDAAFILTQSAGGSGTFYYAVVALKTANGYQGTNAIFLGDRIAPEMTEIKDAQLVVSYADRKPDEPMTAVPSVGVSRYLFVENGTLRE